MFRRSTLLSLALWGMFAAALRIAVAPPESCGRDNSTDIEQAAHSAIDWIRSNQLPDGRYLYLYYPEPDLVSADYNDVRHAGVTMALYQAAGRFHDSDALRAADAGLAWMGQNLMREDDWAAFTATEGQAKLGASALMTAALSERRLATGDTKYDGLMRELGRFMVALQRADGGFYVSWLIVQREPDRSGASRYYPGEAFWALTLLHKAFPNEGWDAPAMRAAGFITTRRDDLEDVAFPPLADQWAAYGLAEMAGWGLSDEQIAYARRLAERFGFLVRTEAQREHGPFGAFVRGGEARAAGAGTWVEGLAALWRLSASDPRLADLEPKIKERLTCGAGILAARQIDDEAAASYPEPQLVRGAWLSKGETRMDDQQHSFSGLIYTIDAMLGRIRREPDAPLSGVMQR